MIIIMIMIIMMLMVMMMLMIKKAKQRRGEEVAQEKESRRRRDQVFFCFILKSFVYLEFSHIIMVRAVGGGGAKGKGESTRLWEEEPAGEGLMAR